MSASSSSPNNNNPTITLQELAKGIIDSWTNSPFNHLKGKPKNEMYKDACWLSYCLHHAVVEAACHGLDIIIRDETEEDKNNQIKKVFLCSVVDGLPKFKDKNAKSHSWNIFQCSDSSGKSPYYSVDLSIDQFQPEQLATPQHASPNNNNNNNKQSDEKKSDKAEDTKTPCYQQPSCYVPVAGTTRVKRDGLYKTEQGSKDWSGRGVFVAGPEFSKAEVETRRDLWPFYLSTIISYATRAKKHAELPKEIEMHQDALPCKNEATELGSNFAFMGDRQGEEAIKPYLDTFKFMAQRIKPCRKMCTQKATPSPAAGSLPKKE